MESSANSEYALFTLTPTVAKPAPTAANNFTKSRDFVLGVCSGKTIYVLKGLGGEEDTCASCVCVRACANQKEKAVIAKTAAYCQRTSKSAIGMSLKDLTFMCGGCPGFCATKDERSIV